MPPPGLAEDMALAVAMADEADAITSGLFKSRSLVVDTKPDMTPVTEADRAVEAAIRELLARERPGDAILGEEFGASGAARRVWIVDPIDGTKNYVRGIPVFATLIALVVDGAPVVGMVSAPLLARRWSAAAGAGARLNDEEISVSRVARLEDAQLSINELGSFRSHGRGEAIERLTGSVWRVRGFGDFWSHVMVAEGAVDVAAEPIVEPWDLAALQVIVEEAGGRFSDLGGRRGYDGGSALSTNGLLHDEVLALFGAATGSGEANG